MSEMKNLKLIIYTLLLTINSLFAQTGSLKGTIKDAKNNEAAIGATIMIKGTTTGTTTDVNGNFELKKLAAGLYNINISYVGYVAKSLENIRIEADKETVISTGLDEDNKTLDQVVVRAQRTSNTEVAVISELRQVNQIAVGISAQQIIKTQDRDASAVVRRVSGVSVFDDRFVIIRGLNERYNTVMLNDIITPSTEVDVKSFSFDLIPSTAIDRMLVYKSATADLPADMGGGAIKIYTKTVPDGNHISAGFTVGYRQNTSFETALSHQGGNTDALGFDDGTRAFPQTFPSRNKVISNAASSGIINKFKALPDYYSVNNQSITPDYRGNVNYSHRWFLGDRELTNISYINYGISNLKLNTIQNRYNFVAGRTETFNDENLQTNVRLGAMSNWALIWSPKTKFEFRNIFNQLANKETVQRSGQNFENNLDVNNQAFRFEQRSIYSGQLSGSHEISEKAKLRWIGALGYTYRQEPDFRRFTSSRESGTNNPFIINLQQFESPTLQQAARFYSVMDEIVPTVSLNYDLILGKKNTDNDDLNKKLKLGIYTEAKNRLFEARWFGIVNPNRVSNETLALEPAKFFDENNLAPSKVYYSEGTNFDDSYAAQNLMAAGFAQFLLPVNERFTANFGLRNEYNRQQLQSRKRGSGAAIDVDNLTVNLLPSANFTYKFSEKNVLRAAYSQTLNRPEFRELAPFTYYDFNFDVARRGNENLKSASIQNLDLRYDFYPSKSEIISLGVFNKQFKNPIEAALFYNGSTVAFTVENADKAYSRGIELEVRKNITSQFTALFNASYITSNVKVGGINDQNRYLQGQSPYLLNTGLFYQSEKKGFQANVLYNVIGPRIFVIGDNVLSANVFEMPRNVIDFNITKTLNKKMDLKFSVQDLLNQPYKLVQDTDRNNKISDTDGIFQSYRRGSNVSLTLNYRIK